MADGRILLIHRYYHPDASPYGRMLHEIAAWLAEDGYDVTVVAAEPTYETRASRSRFRGGEFDSRVQVIRLPMLPERKDQPLRRTVNALSFVLRVFLHVAGRRDDLVTASTQPPVLLAASVRLALCLTGRKGAYLYHCQDLYPEVLFAGRQRPNSVLERSARRVDTATCRAARAVVVLSNDMARTLRRRGLSGDHVEVLNNFALVQGEPSQAAIDRANGLLGAIGHGDGPVMLFAGNLGRFQDLPLVVEATKRVVAEGHPLQLVFVGKGALRTRLAELAGDWHTRAIHFFDHQPPEIAYALMARADVGLVTLAPGMLEVAFPSKTSTYLMAGCPILANVHDHTEMGRLVVENRFGRLVEPGSVDALANALRELERLPQDERHRIRHQAQTIFSREVACQRWRELIHRVL